MGNIILKERKNRKEKNITISTPSKNNISIPSRDNIGYKNLENKLKQLREETEDNEYVIIEK